MATANRVDRAKWNLERAEWDALAAKGEEAGMRKMDVAALRGGFRLFALLEADIDRVAATRGALALVVDSYVQQKARDAAGTAPAQLSPEAAAMEQEVLTAVLEAGQRRELARRDAPKSEAQ